METQAGGIQEEKVLNTNEMMNDYSFFYQMICEHRVLDFESTQPEIKGLAGNRP